MGNMVGWKECIFGIDQECQTFSIKAAMDKLGLLMICVEALTPHETVLKMGYLGRLLKLNEVMRIH